MEDILDRHALTVANGIKGKYSGVVTRERTTKDHTEKSAIDLICISHDLVDEMCSISIDEKKIFCLESIKSTKKVYKPPKAITTQLLVDLGSNGRQVSKVQEKKCSIKKNKEAQAKFTQLTSVNGALTSIVTTSKDVNVATKKLLKRINGFICQSFKKI